MNFSWLKRFDTPGWHRLSAFFATAATVCSAVEPLAAFVPRAVSAPVALVCAFVAQANKVINKKPVKETP